MRATLNVQSEHWTESQSLHPRRLFFVTALAAIWFHFQPQNQLALAQTGVRRPTRPPAAQDRPAEHLGPALLGNVGDGESAPCSSQTPWWGAILAVPTIFRPTVFLESPCLPKLFAPILCILKFPIPIGDDQLQKIVLAYTRAASLSSSACFDITAAQKMQMVLQRLHLEDSDASTLTRLSLDKFYLVCMVASILSVYILYYQL